MKSNCVSQSIRMFAALFSGPAAVVEKSSVPAGEDNQASGGRARSIVAHYRELTGSQLRELKILDPKRRLGSRRQCVFGEGDGSSLTKMSYSDRPVVFRHNLITESLSVWTASFIVL
jgi:hypothetical protein